MWALVESNQVTKVLEIPRALTVNGIKYPGNIMDLWSDAELAGIGIYAYVAAGKKDQTLYDNGPPSYSIDGPGRTVTGTYTPAAKDTLASLKAGLIKSARRQAKGNYREAVDPHYNEKYRVETEGGAHTIPADVKTYAAALKSAVADYKTAVNAAADVADLEVLAVTWPDTPAE